MIEVNNELEEETKTYEFPTSWDEVSVEQFAKIYTASDTKYEGILGSVKVMSAISGIDENILMMMDINDFRNLADQLSFVNQDVPKQDVDCIEIDGEKYYLYSEFNKFTTGEIITIELLLEQGGGNIFPVMLELLCVFLRKKKEDGSFEKYNTNFMNRKDLFRNIPISQIFHIFAFFLTINNSSNKNIVDYLEKISHK
jgi:hypothetical protein